MDVRTIWNNFWNWLRGGRDEAIGPAALTAPPRQSTTGELLLDAFGKASRPGAGTVYLTFDEDGRGAVVETDAGPGGPDLVIGPVAHFPLRPRPVGLASEAMLALQDGKPYTSKVKASRPPPGLADNWPVVEVPSPDKVPPPDEEGPPLAKHL